MHRQRPWSPAGSKDLHGSVLSQQMRNRDVNRAHKGATQSLEVADQRERTGGPFSAAQQAHLAHAARDELDFKNLIL